MRNLNGKTVIVTGGGGGIGGAASRRFAQEGAKVAVFDVNLEAAQKVAEAIRAEGGAAQAFGCDITRRVEVDAAVGGAEAALGPIGVLVNNAGWDVFKPFIKTQPAEWDKLIGINLIGALHMLHAVLPGMAERRYGRIVNIASDAGRGGSSGEAVYAACKGGLVALSKTLAREHARQGITVNVVCPGQRTPPCWPVWPKGRGTPPSCWRRSAAPFRWGGWASPTIWPAPLRFSAAMMPVSSPVRSSACRAA